MALDTDGPLNSLGFAKPPSETRVVVAISGGLDSPVCAACLAHQAIAAVAGTPPADDHEPSLHYKVAY